VGQPRRSADSTRLRPAPTGKIERMTEEVIFVALLDEAVEVWRPVRAERERGNIFRIADQPYDPAEEAWQYEPGDRVVCDLISTSDGEILAAVRAPSEGA
jgi:hypothetical protein